MNHRDPASLQLRGVNSMVDGHAVLRDVALQVLPGELFVVTGGCAAGKTGLLRAIAGLDPLLSGEIWIDDQSIGRLPARRRQTAMLLQCYPLWPNMTVAENVAFGLRRRRLGKREIRERTARELEFVGLGEFAKHLPEQLSDSQRQRVALARTLAVEDRVCLLDEPFSAQDARLRERLLQVLRKRQQQTGTTMLMATQDRGEALRIADRVAVMRDGELQQVGSVQDLYDNPCNRYVAEYMGSVNLLDGEVEYAGEQPLFFTENGLVVPLFDQAVKRARTGAAMFRPHDLHIVASNDEPFGDQIRFSGRIEQSEFRGETLRLWIDLGGRSVWMDLPRHTEAILPQVGDAVVVGLDPARIRILER